MESRNTIDVSHAGRSPAQQRDLTGDGVGMEDTGTMVFMSQGEGQKSIIKQLQEHQLPPQAFSCAPSVQLPPG